MKVVTFKADEQFVAEVDMFAINHGLTRSAVIKMAIERFLSQQEKMKEGRVQILI